MPLGRADVLDLLDALQAEGYVREIERQWDGGSSVYPTPTDKGQHEG